VWGGVWWWLWVLVLGVWLLVWLWWRGWLWGGGAGVAGRWWLVVLWGREGSWAWVVVLVVGLVLGCLGAWRLTPWAALTPCAGPGRARLF
jgi:hypothetical protein